MTSTLLPLSPASPSLELPAGAVFCGWVVPVPFDESIMVEGTFDPTPASSPDAEVRNTLPAGIKKEKYPKQSNSMKLKKVLNCIIS